MKSAQAVTTELHDIEHASDSDAKIHGAPTLSSAARLAGEKEEMESRLKPSAWDDKLAVFATWFSFLMFGLSDGSTGALLPSIQANYNLNYTIVSIIFFSQVLGYGILGLTSTYLLSSIGRRWGVLSGCALFILGQSILLAKPASYVGFVFGYVFLGFAAGFFESTLNAFLGSFRESNAILGFLHGFYGLGGAVAPISATQWISRGLLWYHWYAVLLGIAGTITLLNAYAFRKHTVAYCAREEKAASKRHKTTKAPSVSTIQSEGDTEKGAPLKQTTNQRTVHERTPLKAALLDRICIVGATYMFFYLALELSTAGFIVTYLTTERETTEATAGYVNTGFWIGITLGRFVLTPVAGWMGAWLACQLLTAIGLCCVLTFWLAPNYIGSSIGVALMGFVIGPTFPLVIQLATDYLPPRLHVAGIGLIASLASVGGALFPLVVGIVSTSHGPKAIPPVLVALFAVLLAVWMVLPGPRLTMPWMRKESLKFWKR